MDSLKELPIPAPKEGMKVPHQGNYSPEDVAWARENGYDPVDIRFTGSAYLALQGVIMGTVQLTDEQLKALELRARLEKSGHHDPIENAQTQSRRHDLEEALAGIPISTLYIAKGGKKK